MPGSKDTEEGPAEGSSQQSEATVPISTHSFQSPANAVAAEAKAEEHPTRDVSTTGQSISCGISLEASQPGVEPVIMEAPFHNLIFLLKGELS